MSGFQKQIYGLTWGRYVLPLLIVLAYVPLLLDYFRGLWLREHYQYFPIVLLFTGMLARRRWKQAPPVTRPFSQPLVLCLIGLSFALLALGILTLSPQLAMLSAIVGLGAALLVVRSRRAVCNALGIWCLLWLLVRVPFKLDLQLISWFQTITTNGSSALLDVLGILHLTDGHVLSFPNKDFFVSEACSGIMSLMALFAATALLVVMQDRALLHGGLVLVSAFFWAALMNTVRILIIAYAYGRFGRDLAVGWQHECLSMATFGLALGGVFSTDRFLQFILRPALSPRTRRVQSRNRCIRIWNGITTLGDPSHVALSVSPSETGSGSKQMLTASAMRAIGAALAVLVCLQVTVSAFRPRQNLKTPDPIGTEVSHDFLTAASVSSPHQAWQQVHFGPVHRESRSPWGEKSYIWTYRSGEMLIRMAIDFPFYEYHDLAECYSNRGWDLLHRQVLGEQEGFSSEVATEIDLHKASTNEHAYCLSGAMDPVGQWVEHPKESLKERLKERFAWATPAQATQPLYQLQVFVASGDRLGKSQRTDLRSAIKHFHRELQHQFQNRIK